MHISEDASLFISLTTIPFGKADDFFTKEVQVFFKKFKERCQRNGLNTKGVDDPFTNSFYEPRPYALFGNFDLAIISLVDDFNLGTHTFHPFSPLFGEDGNCNEFFENFSYQVFTGPGVKQYASIDKYNLIEKSKRTFMCPEEQRLNKCPFIAITALKLNNSLLIGNGGKLFELAVEAINNVIRNYKKKFPQYANIEYILTESYSWHEFTIVFFSDSYKTITDLLIRIRELDLNLICLFATDEMKIKIEELKAFLTDSAAGPRPAILEEIEKRQRFIDTGMDWFKRDFETNSLLAKAIEKNKKNGNSADTYSVYNAHAFVSTYTTFGYDFSLIKYTPEELKTKFNIDLEKLDREIMLFSKWYTKPGHLQSSVNLLYRKNQSAGQETPADKKSGDINDNTLSDTGKAMTVTGELSLPPAGPEPVSVSDAETSKAKRPLHVLVGSGDYLMPDAHQSLSSILRLHNHLTSVKADDNAVQLQRHIHKINCVPYVVYDDDYEELFKHMVEEKYSLVSETGHFYLNETLRLHSFNRAEINLMRTNLVKLKCSKVLREKVLNMLANFNDCITDPVLYSFFIELRPYVLKIQNLVNCKYLLKGNEPNLSDADKKYAAKTLDKVHDELDFLVEQFDRAFKNRFHQSYRMNEITDFNIELNGGIQQIVSGLDSAYKTLRKSMGEVDDSSFVYVSGNTNVVSDLITMRLNYFHVFQPETYVAVVVKEAFNYTLDRRYLDVSETQEEFKSYTTLKRNVAVYDDNVIASNRLKIKNRLLQSDALKKARMNSSRFEELFAYVDASMIDYFLADRVVFGYGYNYNEKLYNYWIWNFAAQLSTQYDKDGSFNNECFIKMMLRMSFVFRHTGRTDDTTRYKLKSFWLDQRFTPPNNILQKLWLQYFDEINEFTDILLADDDFRKLFDFAIKIAGWIIKDDSDIEPGKEPVVSISGNESDERKKAGDKWAKELAMFTRSCYHLFNIKSVEMILTETDREGNIIMPSAENSYYKFRKMAISTLKEFAKKMLKQGRIFAYDYKENTALKGYRNIYLLALFNAYMELIYEENMGDNIPVLFRDPENGHVVSTMDTGTSADGVGTDKINYAPLSFDPLGGIYSMTTGARRNYFKYRAAFIKSMYDYSLKQKKHLFTFRGESTAAKN